MSSINQQFNIYITPTISVPQTIKLEAVWSDAGGSYINQISEYRINGGAWQPMVNVGVVYSATYNQYGNAYAAFIEVRENNAKIFELGTYNLPDLNSGCRDGENTFDPLGNLLTYFISLNTNPLIDTLKVQASGNSLTINDHSIDGGATYKTAGGTGFTSWTDAELGAINPQDINVKILAYGGPTTVGCFSLQDIKYTYPLAFISLSAAETHTNPTVNGGADGTISVIVADGSGNFTYLWSDGNTNKDRTGLVAGNYGLVITDTDNAETFNLDNILLTEPAEEVAEFPNSLVTSSPINPIRFKENVSGEDLPLENYNFCEHPTENMTKPFTPEIFNVQDQTVLQFISDYAINILKRENTDTGLIVDLPLTLKVDNLSGGQTNNITISDNGIFNGSSTIRLNRENLPAYPNPSVGDIVLINSSTSYDGSYAIVDISADLLYIVINTPYILDESAQIKFVSSLRFNVYELPISFVDWGVGTYELVLGTSDGLVAGTSLVSEYIEVKPYTPNTLLLKYSNNDNAYGVVWTTDIIMTKRHEGFFVKAVPTRDSTNFRNSNDSPGILNAYIRNKEEYNVFNLPWFSVQRLALIYSCDNFVLNGKIMFVEELPETEQPASRYLLGKHTVIAEQIGWLDNQNTHDIGDTSEDSIVIGGDTEEVLGV